MLKTALFVDFDNAFSLVATTGPAAAKRFGHDPAGWLARLEAGPGGPRRILLRRAWLNPDLYGGFRGALVRAGFTVSDCPALTRNGKNAADIAMALEIVDALGHPTRFDEFLILSGDADFTPVLIRLREHDRRTAILGAVAVGALRAAADRVLIPGDLVDGAGVSPGPVPTPAAPHPAREKALDAIEAMLAAGGGRLPAASVATGLLDRFGEDIRRSGWFGAGSFGKLLKASGRPGVACDFAEGGQVFDPRAVTDPSTGSTAPGSPDQDLAALVDRLSGAGFPGLSSAQIAAVLDETARQIAAGVVERNALGVAVRDALRDTEPVSRARIQFLLNGIGLAGGVFGETCRTAGEMRLFLGKSLWTFHTNKVGPLSEPDLALLHRLVGLEAPAPTDSGASPSSPPP